MRVVRRIHFRLPKLSSPRPLLERLIGALQRHDIALPAPHIHLEQSEHIGTTAIERTIRRFSELRPYATSYQDGNGRDVAVLSSLSVPSNIPWATALAIADGVPRSFPFSQASFLVGPLNWLRASVPPSLPIGQHVGALFEAFHDTPSIIVNSNWWITKRQYSMLAIVPVLAPVSCTTLPTPPSNVAEALSELGTPKQEELVPTLDPAEQDRIDEASPGVTRLTNAYDESVDEIAATLPFAYVLPHPLHTFSPSDYEACGTLKPFLAQAYRGLGYAYESRDSGQGMFVLRKRTAKNHNLEVHVDVGSYSRNASFLLCLNGPGWRTRALVPVNGHAGHCLGYPIVNAEFWRRIVSNSVVAVRYLESTFVPEVEGLYPDAPAWYRYGL